MGNYNWPAPFKRATGFSSSVKEEDLHIKLLDWLRNAESSTPETSYREISEEDYDFYAGDQDTDAVIAELQNQKRPTTTYNEVKPKIDMLVGLADQMRMMPEVVPTGVEDEALAEIAQSALLHFRYNLKIPRKEMDCFEHMVKGGRALLGFWIDKTNPFKPEIKPVVVRGRNFYLDPDSVEYDMSDARHLFIDKWMTEEQIKTRWPKFKTGEVQQVYGKTGHEPTFFNEFNLKYRIVECWYRQIDEVRWFIHPQTGEPTWVLKEDWSNTAAGIQEMMGGEGGEAPEFWKGTKENIYYAIFDGVRILEGGISQYKWQSFPYVIFGAYKHESKNFFYGAIKEMKDPQRGLNTMRRQLLHLLNTSPKGILLHETGAVLNVEEYEQRGSDPTFHMELSRDALASGRVRFSDQPSISPVYNALDEAFRQGMKDSSGIQDSLLGFQQSSREAGVTVKMRQEAGMSVLYILFANFRDARIEGSKLLMTLVQQYCDYPMLIRLEDKNKELIPINTQMNPQSPDFNDISVGTYDVRIDEQAENLTMRQSALQILMEYAHNAPGTIPPDIILEYMNLPFSVKQRVLQYQEEQRQMEMAMLAMEMESKERIASTKASQKEEGKKKKSSKKED
jgi:hypothetical protein